MTEEIPAHRATVTPRSGDTHVIGADGKLVNVDEAARKKAAPAAKARDPLDHDGDGRKGGSLPRGGKPATA